MRRPAMSICLPLHSIKGLQFLGTAFSWCLFKSEAFGILTGWPHVLRRQSISPSGDCTSFRSSLPLSRSFSGDSVALAAFLTAAEPRHSQQWHMQIHSPVSTAAVFLCELTRLRLFLALWLLRWVAGGVCVCRGLSFI